jgi:sugar phosphate permease
MDTGAEPRRAWTIALWLGLGYVAIYLCRKNLGVAVPLLQSAFGADKAQVGIIASASTVAYMAGKFLSGPVIDRVGGRAGFLAALAGVGLFGALSALSPGLTMLTVLYSLNRFSGAWGWNAIVKLIASWFPPRRLGTAIAAVSMSYVFGGVLATLFAARVAAAGGGWRAVMAVPSLVMLLVIPACGYFLRTGPLREIPVDEAEQAPRPGVAWGRQVQRLLARPQFQTLCILSFTLTLVREAFSTWGVDYLYSLQSGQKSVAAAGLLSTSFDLPGAIPVLLMGVAYDRLSPAARRWTVVGILVLLSATLAGLRSVTQGNVLAAALLLAAAGLLLYGPYSILAGVVSIETGGTDLAGTACGFVDGVGYLAAILSGYALGWVLDRGGYSYAFAAMAVLTLLSALAALRLRGEPPVAMPLPVEEGVAEHGGEAGGAPATGRNPVDQESNEL